MSDINFLAKPLSMHVIWYNFCYQPEWRIFPRVHLVQNKMYHAMFDLLFLVLMQEISVRK